MTTDPLPLTTFEQFLLWEDRPAYPWSCFVRLRFAGHLEREPFVQAIQWSLDRHPLLAAKVARRGGRLYWIFEPDHRPAILWSAGERTTNSVTEAHLDLFQEPGSRFRVWSDPEHCELQLQFHHACCDGKGLFHFLGDLLAACHAFTGEAAEPSLPAVKQEHLTRRGRPWRSHMELLRLVPRQAIGLIGAKEFLSRSPNPLIPHQTVDDDATVPAGYPTTVVHHFSLDDTAQLLRKCRHQPATVNDMLARDLFLALLSFRDKYQPDGGEHWLRMMIPMDLRTVDHHEMPAANVVSAVFLDRQSSDAMDPASLLQGIQAQMGQIKRNRLGLTFLLSLQLCRLLPGGLRKQSRRDKCNVSCIFTNIGRVFENLTVPRESSQLQVGHATLKSIEVSIPNRPYNCVSFSALTYANRLSITLHFDPRVLTRSQGEDLMTMFVQHVKSTE